MTFSFANTPEPVSFSSDILPAEVPAFLTYAPNFEQIEKAVAKYSHIEHLVVIGHGGSMTGFIGLYESLKDKTKVKAYFVQTTDPDLITTLLSLPKDKTLVVSISKSGETVTQIEATLAFKEFACLFVTNPTSTLASIAKSVNAEVFEHPVIGGRYTAFTEVLLLPAALCGLNVREFFAAGREIHGWFAKENSAFALASILWQLEQKGFNEVFMPIYSHYLFAWNLLIVQLCHESFGKNGKGGTYVSFEGPESQHHSNQRFFGGQKNMTGLFIGLENFQHSIDTSVPDAIKELPLRTGKMADLNGVPLKTSMQFELEATVEDAAAQQIPVITMSVSDRTEKSLGAFVAFWQLYAVYGSLVRKSDPFDQPQVESSKVISFQKRKEYRAN